MLSGTVKTGIALLLATLAFEACSTPAETSTGTNWITCKTDADCEGHPGTRCTEKRRCEVFGDQEPIDGPDASSTGAGGESGSGGKVGTGGAAGNDGLIGISGRGVSSGGVDGTGGSLGPSGQGNIGGDQGIGGGESNGIAGFGGGEADAGLGTRCYSPGQNLQRATSTVGALGCRCTESQTPDGLCLTVPNGGGNVALLCEDGHWAVHGSNTACSGCWTPDQPEFANTFPNSGCPCVNENENVCIVTQNEGYNHAVCKGGKWKLDPTLNSCSCANDARCGFGGKCVGQSCASRVCEVDGVRYAVGVSFPSPSDDCNTCECDETGHLTCTTRECAETACPGGTVQARACVGCGLAGGCGLWRFGCLPRCATNSDCARTGTPVCDPTDHVCTAMGCD